MMKTGARARAGASAAPGPGASTTSSASLEEAGDESEHQTGPEPERQPFGHPLQGEASRWTGQLTGADQFGRPPSGTGSAAGCSTPSHPGRADLPARRPGWPLSPSTSLRPRSGDGCLASRCHRWWQGPFGAGARGPAELVLGLGRFRTGTSFGGGSLRRARTPEGHTAAIGWDVGGNAGSKGMRQAASEEIVSGRWEGCGRTG